MGNLCCNFCPISSGIEDRDLLRPFSSPDKGVPKLREAISHGADHAQTCDHNPLSHTHTCSENNLNNTSSPPRERIEVRGNKIWMSTPTLALPHRRGRETDGSQFSRFEGDQPVMTNYPYRPVRFCLLPGEEAFCDSKRKPLPIRSRKEWRLLAFRDRRVVCIRRSNAGIF